DQRLWSMHVLARLELLQDRNHERRRFAGAGASLADHVLARKGQRNKARLNVRGGGVACLFQGGLHHFRELDFLVTLGGGRSSLQVTSCVVHSRLGRGGR